MDDILSPIAKLDLDDYNECFSMYSNDYDFNDEINGNVPNDASKSNLINCKQQSLQTSLENLVNNFDSVISECFSSDEKMDSFSPISEKYRTATESIDKNQLWLSLTGSMNRALNLDWKNFKSFQEFKQALHICEYQDTLNQNLDLPDDEELAIAMDHHSLITSCLPGDYEPLKTADEIIQEIDKIMGFSGLDDSNDDFRSDINNSSFIGSQEAIDFRRSLLSRPEGWGEGLHNMNYKELNDILDELEDSIRDYSCLLVEELATREDLEYEKEQRDIFVKLIHDIEQRQKINEKVKSKNFAGVFIEEQPKRSHSWKSIFSQNSKSTNNANGRCNNKDIYSEISRSSENIRQSLGVSIPVHQYTRLDRDTLLIFNQMLQAMLHNPKCFNQLFTDYVLNVYAPADDVSLDMNLEII